MTAKPASVSRIRNPKPDSRKPVVRFRLRITAGDTVAIGPGKIQLLEAIQETGSLTAAAKHIDMSYRRAWILINELNSALKAPAVESAKGGEHGGGSVLTSVGQRLVTQYRSIEDAAASSCKAQIRALTSLLAPSGD
jgi:molybdate transport system regulatory protein